ncbi:MAG: hypothetical protein J5679_03340 [Alphaproteobacteria bacterium]|nr:hypothetical protein [Alphaproteobacteria bacterium]
MHLFKKTLGLIAVLSVIPAAYAATSRGDARVSVNSAASRMPNLSVSKGTSSSQTTTGATTTAASLLANSECIDTYRECISAEDACGENFEECTNRILFHAQMPKCLSTLTQCSTTGVESLFGTSVVSNLSNVASKNTYGEITDYTYPTDGSVLGQMITAAAIANRYDTSTCVRRYTSCLKKDTVCGADFELCTTDKDFRKQRVFCDSTLARCNGEGIKELLGSAELTASPSKSSRVGELISEGAALAAVNSVATCYKTVDQCILNACSDNPYRCYESAQNEAGTAILADFADTIVNGGSTVEDLAPSTLDKLSKVVDKKAIKDHISNACFETIGANKYCYAASVVGDGKMPTAAQLRDPDNQRDVFDDLYSSRMNDGMKAKIAELVDKFDTKAKSKCTETIKSCAMRVCGGGSGAACYKQVFGKKDTEESVQSINGSATYEQIKTGCEAIVNTDLNCKYAAANLSASGPYTYSYINNNAFTTLFPEHDDDGNENDVIGVVASLNSALATSYNDAALAQMKKQCQTVAASCIKTMCGNDYVNCYRNRTDIYSNLTDSGNTAYDRSMNKVNGVLDYTVILGLCLDTVKNATACEEQLKIEAVQIGDETKATSARKSWVDAGKVKLTGEDAIYATDENGNYLCRNAAGAQGQCDTMAPDHTYYTEPIIIGYETYVQSQAAESLFADLIYDIEKEAQAKYNAKLTKEQNMCLSSNSGGIIGTKDMGGTFMWAKLKNNKVPSDYNVSGLKSSQFVASNDLYGSFCRVRVTLQSDDKNIQDAMKGKDWTTAYFATGDAFTCGSWIPSSALESIANSVAKDKAGSVDDAAHKRTQFWTTTLATLGGGVGGYFLGEGIRNGSVMGGLTGLTGNEANKRAEQKAENATSCVNAIELYQDTNSSPTSRVGYAEEAVAFAEKAGVNSAVIDEYDNAVASHGKTNDTDLANALRTPMQHLKTQCAAIARTNAEQQTTTDAKGKSSTNWGITAATTGVTALASGLLVYKATRDMQQTLLDDEQRAAYEEFMNSVGRHITCYIGGDEAGSYGDVITTSLE